MPQLNLVLRLGASRKPALPAAAAAAGAAGPGGHSTISEHAAARTLTMPELFTVHSTRGGCLH
jgi:hypothetical protein